MTKMLDEFEKWLLTQEKKPVKGEMTLGVINEYRSHMCKKAFEAGFNAGKEILPTKAVAWRQTVHVEKGGNKSIKYLYNNEKIMVDDEPLYTAQPSTEALQEDKANLKEQLSKMRDDLHKVTSTLEIKAKDLAWWQNQFQSKSGVETKEIAKSFIELTEKLAEAQSCKVELIEYANTAFNLVQKLHQNTRSHNPMNQIMNDAHIFLRQQRPKCMGEWISDEI